MLTNEVAKRLLNNLLEIIQDLSDKEYQKRIWIRGEGPEIDDFTEAVCRFFENGDPILSEYKRCGMTEGQKELLKRFQDKFKAFADDNYSLEEFIDTPEWTEITEMAKKVLEAFDYKK